MTIDALNRALLARQLLWMRAEAELEKTRMQLAACGVIAMANTSDSAKAVRNMHSDYDCASVRDIASAVDREIENREKLEAAEAREKKLLAAVKNIAKQRLHAEITDCDPDEIDWLSGYEGCVKEARAALAETAP